LEGIYVSVKSVTTVETLLAVQSEVQEFQIKQGPDEQVKMELAIALGVQAVKKRARGRGVRVKEVRVRFDAGTYQQDSKAIAQKMLAIE
jgi:anti-sigma28 factor (negative regulator of flagellin synthesis)